MPKNEVNWPPQYPRTPDPDRGRNRNYRVSLTAAFQKLETQLDRMGVDDFSYGFDADQHKEDERPYANASVGDPSFVCRFSIDGNQYAVGCDRYSKLRDNVRTVGLYLKEKRKMDDRPVATGTSEFANMALPGNGDPVDESQQGFGATPLGNGQPERRPKPVLDEPAHEVLQVAEGADEQVVEAAFRSRMKDVHPDHGGDADEYKKLVKAKEAMLS